MDFTTYLNRCWKMLIIIRKWIIYIYLYFHREKRQTWGTISTTTSWGFWIGKTWRVNFKWKKYVYDDALQFPLNTVGKWKTSGNTEATVNAKIEASSGDKDDEEEDHVQPPSTSSGSWFSPAPRTASRQE